MTGAHWLDLGSLARLASEGTTAHRICSADHCWIERFGRTALLSVKNPGIADSLIREMDEWLAEAGVEIPRLYLRPLVLQPGEKDQPVLLRGDPEAPPREVVTESGLNFEVDFSAGYSVGLFCDQRANRMRLRSLRPRRVLNTFAYTCAFSVAAAGEGAETLSVDLSKASLARGRRNFELNEIALSGHRFLADDVMAVLPRLAQRGEKFDTIILDPPTFGRSSPRRTFRAERDYGKLIALALACAEPGARLLLSTNCSKLAVGALRLLGRREVSAVRFWSEPSQPDIPSSHAAAATWMELPQG